MCEFVFEGEECLILGFSPIEFVILLGHGSQWGSNGAEVFDKSSVEACQSMEAAHLMDGCWSWPLLDGLNLGLVYFDAL